MSVEEPLIAFEGVRKYFGSKRVYESLDLNIRRGESLTIIGGSGQGKSVMLKLLIGLLRLDAGSIRFDGEELSQLDEHEFVHVRKRIGMLFQNAALFDSLSVHENIAYGLREHYEMEEDAIHERVKESLGNVGLSGIEHMWPSDLSGGMRKRVGLARAIAVRPEVLLYDEPTTGLDPINTTRINRLIVGLKHSLEVTSVVVTHDMQSARAISDRVAMVHEGQVIFTGTPEELMKSAEPRVRSFVTGDAEDETLDELMRS